MEVNMKPKCNYCYSELYKVELFTSIEYNCDCVKLINNPKILEEKSINIAELSLGKSKIVEQWAKENNLPIVNLDNAISEQSELNKISDIGIMIGIIDLIMGGAHISNIMWDRYQKIVESQYKKTLK